MLKKPSVKPLLPMLALALTSTLPTWANAFSIELEHIVEPVDNLYYNDWGHSYDQTFDQTDQSHLDNPEPYALGAGQAARSVHDYDDVAYNFTSYDYVDISAEGWITDQQQQWTNVDGTGDYDFRGLPVYSLIGIWSTQANQIDPINAAFFIGSSLTVAIPEASEAYLFLAENDGWFFDNGEYRMDTNGEWENYYDVSMNLYNVPEPSSMMLLLTGGLMFWGSRRLTETG